MDVRLVDHGWAAELAALVQRHPRRLRIVCPFIKRDALARIAGGTVPADTRVVTRFNLADFASCVTDIGALREVMEAGGEVRGIKGLHAKVFVFGDGAAAVTSANLTQRGLHFNEEFGCVSELPGFVVRCQEYFDGLWTSGASVSLEQLDEWEARVTALLLTGARSGPSAGLPDYGGEPNAEQPVAPLPPTDSEDRERPAWVTEAPCGRVKFFGQSHERSPRTEIVLDEVRASGSHWSCTYPKNRRPRSVQEGEVMYLAAMVHSPNDYLIYGRAVGMAYVYGRDDATPQDIALRSWRDHWPHYIRVHHAEFLAGSLSNGVSLNQLMDELKADAFAATQENAAAGLGHNTNPRASLRQKPDIRLSDEGLAWMHERFEAALRKHGRIPADDLATLDWPAVPASA